MTIVANCNRALKTARDAQSAAREAVNNPNMIASTRQATMVANCNRASRENIKSAHVNQRVDCSELADDLTNAKSEEDRSAIILETVTLIMIAKDGQVRWPSNQHDMLERMAAQGALAASVVDGVKSQLDPISTRQNRRGHLDDIVVSIEGELRRLSDLVGFYAKENQEYGNKYRSSAKIEKKPYSLGEFYCSLLPLSRYLHFHLTNYIDETGTYELASDAALAYDTFIKQASGDKCKTNYAANSQDHMRYRDQS